ncbi:MAG: hypothetical protein P4L96_23400 [Rhodoferax sp.]|nr:hypothetical protein [Rhodoferax sp.]
MKHLTSYACRAGTCLLAACCAFSGNTLAAPSMVKPQPGSQIWLAASNRTLDRMRGGFDIGGGLVVSFGFERSVAINGNPIITISFNIPNMALITPQQAALVSQQLGTLNLIQNGPGNSVQPTPSSGSSSVSASAVSPGPITVNPVSPGPATASSVSSGPVTASSVSPGPATVNPVSPGAVSPSSVTLNTVTVSSAPISGAALGTFIQNTLNNQQIQSQTVINASTNSLGMYKGMNMYNALNSALSNSLGTR